MPSQRRRRGFEPAGQVGGKALGLGATRGRELELKAAWGLAVGPELSDKLSVVSLERDGTLVVRYDGHDAAWLHTLDCMLPKLGARMADRMSHRSLWRVRRQRHETDITEPAAVSIESRGTSDPTGEKPSRLPVARPKKNITVTEENLRRVMQAYLDRREEP